MIASLVFPYNAAWNKKSIKSAELAKLNMAHTICDEGVAMTLDVCVLV